MKRPKLKPYKLGVIVPTNNPTSLHRYLLPTVEYLVPMTDQAEIKFLFTFQEPFSDEQFYWPQQIGFRSCTHVNDGPVASMTTLRGRAAMLWPEADYYMFADDNLVFNAKGTAMYPEPSWFRYEQAIEYMQRFENCGTLMCDGSLGGSAQHYEIRPAKHGLVGTARGLFYRNVFEGRMFTPEELKLIGSLEEMHPTYRMMTRGMFFAKQFNNPTLHKGKAPRGSYHDVPNGISNSAILAENGQRHIREVYDDPTWVLESMRVPRLAKELYLKNGGRKDDVERYRMEFK